MNEQELKEQLQHATQTRLSGLKPDPWLTQRVCNIAQQHVHTKKKISLKGVALIIALILGLCGVAYAVYEGLTADLYGWFYGKDWKKELQAGDQAIMGQHKQLGDVVYTIEEVIYKKDGDFQGLYSTIRIRPAEGSNVVLIPSDTSVYEPAGCQPHLGQSVPVGAPSYAELAKEQGAKIFVARASAKRLVVNGEECLGSFGEFWLPQPDGSLLGAMEINDHVPRAEQYELTLSLSNWEVTLDDEYLREEPNNTWLKEEWKVIVQPTIKEENQ
ncbi:MAG: hypothetical protein RR301_07215 [Clostridia bacterium]